jgi:hypothetical protein
MADSMKLAGAIIEAAASPSDQVAALDKNVADFEQDMFERATDTQQVTYDMMHSMFMTPGAPRSGIEKFLVRAVEGEMGYWTTHLLVKPIVYIYFFFFKLIW